MNKFKDLLVWQKAIDLTVTVYTLTKSFPADEKFGLISQIRRSVISIPSNIAEGAGRGTKGEFKQFLMIALGSSYELETQVILSGRLIATISELSLVEVLDKVNEVQKMILGLHKSLV
jgi:four helix bundle protein